MHDLNGCQDFAYYHGSNEPLAETVIAGDDTRWWSPMDHGVFLDPPWEDGDASDNGELAAELRTAYANIVFEAFLNSDNTELRELAEVFGLSGLGSQVGIIFFTDDLRYVERYGTAHEIDIKAEGVLAVMSDENASRPSWFMVMRAGSPFPMKRVFQPAITPGG